jgi:hypothetical protein
MTKFTLINPVIVGKMETKVKAENGLEAASKFWSELGSYISGNVPKTYISLKDDSGKLSHYKIEEKIGKSKTAEYTISEFNVQLSEDKEKKLKRAVKKYVKKGKSLMKEGGSVEEKPKRNRSKDSSSSSSMDSEDDDYYNFRRYRSHMYSPLNLLYYTTVVYGVDVFFPTFTTTLSPYVTLYVPF